MAEVIRQDFANRLVATEEENKQLKMEMSEQKARHQVQLNQAKVDIEAVERAKDYEMEEVHRRWVWLRVGVAWAGGRGLGYGRGLRKWVGLEEVGVA